MNEELVKNTCSGSDDSEDKVITKEDTNDDYEYNCDNNEDNSNNYHHH